MLAIAAQSGLSGADPVPALLRWPAPAVAEQHGGGSHALTWAVERGDESGDCGRCVLAGDCLDAARTTRRIAAPAWREARPCNCDSASKFDPGRITLIALILLMFYRLMSAGDRLPILTP